MSNITFGQLPNQTSITATTIIPTVSANTNYTVTVANLQAYINANSTGSYSNANATSLMANFGSNTITTTGNITGGYFLGNGRQLTGITSSQGTTGAQGTTGVQGTQGTTGVQGTQGTTGTFGGNLTANINGNGYGIANVAFVCAVGNVAGSYVLGNGSQLTGINANYGNANVAVFLPTYSGNIANVTIPGGLSVIGTTNLVGTATLHAYIETTAASVNTGTSFTPAMTNGPVQQLTATANFALNLPTGMSAGSSITLVITQDATGNRIMTPNAGYKFGYGVKTLSTAAGAVDMMSIFYTGTSYLCNLVKGYS